MFDELFPSDREVSLSQSVKRPEKSAEAGVWSGFGSALSDSLPYAAMTSARSWGAMLNAVQAVAAESVSGLLPKPIAGGHPTIESLAGEKLFETEKAGEIAKNFAPDPSSVGIAGQIVHGVASSVVKAGIYSLAGPAGPVLFGADAGINRAQELSDQGVDSNTAAISGVVSGVANAVGMRLPAAMGANRIKSAALGGVVNPALNVVETSAIQKILEHADYEKIATQYQPLDPINLTVSAITGSVFGGAFHKSKGNPTHLTPDEHAAALTMNEARVRDSDTLTKKSDIAAANIAKDAQIIARNQLDSGEQVSVAHGISVERSKLDDAYQRVLDSHAGEAFDPLVHIQPEDIDGVVIARGGWHGYGDVEIKGAGWGLVKFIWKHGEQSDKSVNSQIIRNDILSFPEIIREFEPSRQASADGSLGREWRVLMPDEQGNLRTVVYADNLINGQRNRHLVTVHVEKQNGQANDLPLSAKRKTNANSESPELMLESRYRDTPNGVLHHLGQNALDGSNIAQAGFLQKAREIVNGVFGVGENHKKLENDLNMGAQTPEQSRALDIALRNPDAMIRLEDGSEVRMADLIKQAHEIEMQTKTDAAAFEAAVNCALRFPQ